MCFGFPGIFAFRFLPEIIIIVRKKGFLWVLQIQAGIVLFKPKDFPQAREIIDHLMPNHAVIINLEGIEPENLRRMVDFFAGVAYGIQGKFTKAARLTYVIAPPDVECEDERFDRWEQEDPMVL